ncbi:MAG: 3-phosphoshikimate 1-carboxyvinyltransferase [Nitrososphaerota archaeon]
MVGRMKLVRVRQREEVFGDVTAPPSKSYTHRAVFVASLSDGTSTVRSPLISRDTVATINAVRAFGAQVDQREGLLVVEGMERPQVPEDVIDAMNSGTTLRIATAVASLVEGGYTVLTGDGSLRRRPMGPLLEALGQLGVEAWSTRNNGCAPVVVKGEGGLRGKCAMRGDVSSQFVSGLIVAGSASDGALEVSLTGEVVSRPYIEATCEVVRRFGGRVSLEGSRVLVEGGGLRAREFVVPGDYGLAAFLMAVPLLMGGSVRVWNLDRSLPQADAAILEVLREMGARFREGENYVEVFGSDLHGVHVDLRDAPDLLPVVAVLACFAEGETVVSGVGHARYKETDRIAVLARELSKAGATVEEKRDGLVVRGAELREAVLDPEGDHRLFMAFALLSLASQGKVATLGVESVDVSYPNFLRDLSAVGCEVEVRDAG